MKIAQYLEAARKLPIIGREELTGHAPIVVLSPHPDDETLGLGGLIAQARSAGQEVHVVVLTDGAGSHPNSIEYPPEKLIDLRKAEVRAAGEILGMDQACIHHLDLPDTKLHPKGRRSMRRSGSCLSSSAGQVRRTSSSLGIRTLIATTRPQPPSPPAF